MRSFYAATLGMTELEKPERLRARGGAWFRSGSLEIHVGIEEGFRPARKAHPGIAVDDVDALAERVAGSGAPGRVGRQHPRGAALPHERPGGQPPRVPAGLRRVTRSAHSTMPVGAQSAHSTGRERVRAG